MIATRAVLVAGGILVGFLFGGHLLLRALGIPLPSFQIAGGIVLFLFALTMIFGPSKADQEKEEVGTIEQRPQHRRLSPRDPLDRQPRRDAWRGAPQRHREASAREQPARSRGDLRRARRDPDLHVRGEADPPGDRRFRRERAQPDHGPDPRRRRGRQRALRGRAVLQHPAASAAAGCCSRRSAVRPARRCSRRSGTRRSRRSGRRRSRRSAWRRSAGSARCRGTSPESKPAAAPPRSAGSRC